MGAAVWAFAFAALSAYWAAGGTGGAGTLAAGLADEAAAREPGFVALLWATAAAKALLGVLALAIARPGPPRLLRTAAGLAGAALLLYAAGNVLVFALMATGVREVPSSVGADAVVWYLALWEPLWILGGALFLAAARRAPAYPAAR